MTAKNITRRAKLTLVTKDTTLPKLLRLARGDRTLAEMAERCGLHLMTIQRVETGSIALPKRETMAALSRGYEIPLELLARVAYCGGVTDDPEGSDDTGHLETAAPVESNKAAWQHPTQPRRSRATVST